MKVAAFDVTDTCGLTADLERLDGGIEPFEISVTVTLTVSGAANRLAGTDATSWVFVGSVARFSVKAP